MKIGITTIPFSSSNLELLESKGYEIKINTFGKKITYDQTVDFLKDCDAVIAGTEKYDSLILSELKNLKLISRVGVGLDNVDMIEAKKLGIKILNPPEDPSFEWLNIV